jgi:hypothetical protein
MIRFYRSATITPGKMAGAMTFAREVAKYVKDHTGVDVHIGMPVGGNPHRIGWSAQYPNLAAYDEMATKLLADGKYQEMVAMAANNFVADTTRDELWRVL